MDQVKQVHDREVAQVRFQYSEQVAGLEASQAGLQRELQGLQEDLRLTEESLRLQRDENTQLKGTIAQQSTTYEVLEGTCQALRRQLSSTEDTLAQREARIADLEVQLAASHDLTADLEARLRDEETTRRRLHNTIQELKGNIRVFCRVRPILPSDGLATADGAPASDSMPHIRYPEPNEIEIIQTTESASSGKTTAKAIPFSFDRVFPPRTDQLAVFEEIAQLVQSALDGYPVCIFAYGQTGSGKTHTMEGPDHPTEATMGMIPRAVRQIYAGAEALKAKGWVYTMEGQFLEIYNEAIHDLLVESPASSAGGNGTSPSGGVSTRKHEIRHITASKTIVTDATSVVMDSSDQVHTLLKRASKNRAVAATNCNERSSRSHSVFTLRLTGRNSASDEVSEGVLNLIDLAGSERLSQSGSTGDRLKETQAINKSLSCLGDVIYAIANRDSHVPYRNSKLTYLLQNSLGGNSKTLMFVNMSPLANNLQETLCSLRFATKVNSCHIGTARRNLK
ncbi:P-loop containing nucleoside triphosphate hydrolase protein [Dimargaris cristalligena]|uniref:Kinesin-like protein n=1 Tax=Dimargaris cristalligena TaxID=215637 RepID=A0A4P9ZN44_9FUNG|nr:P-loop containing nucleoside triphosphate hydrolase protein [Dimargaris cristalligena]|eukprot:RKP33730.1 P-loop containing nucleoside triphosphate hydrolase protein [Dimargaris cristalligena]